MVQLDGTAAGVLYHGHEPWSGPGQRFGRVNVRLVPEVRTAARLRDLLDRAVAMELATGAEALVASAREHDDVKRAAIEAVGFQPDRTARWWELDLTANRESLERMAAASRARMTAAGVTVGTLADDRDPDVMRKLHRLDDEGTADIPTTVPHTRLPFEVFLMWFDSPGLRRDRFWIARRGEQLLGLSVLEYPPGGGRVRTDFTTVSRAARGLGVARALKLETLLQAIELGVPSVRTENDGANSPILHLNETMGYRRISGEVGYLKQA